LKRVVSQSTNAERSSLPVYPTITHHLRVRAGCYNHNDRYNAQQFETLVNFRGVCWPILEGYLKLNPDNAVG